MCTRCSCFVNGFPVYFFFENTLQAEFKRERPLGKFKLDDDEFTSASPSGIGPGWWTANTRLVLDT
jgi:hypothetical protein